MYVKIHICVLNCAAKGDVVTKYNCSFIHQFLFFPLVHKKNVSLSIKNWDKTQAKSGRKANLKIIYTKCINATKTEPHLINEHQSVFFF